MIEDLMQYSVMNLRRRSLRSWLTIIGIIIGVFSIVVMVSLAQGLDDYIRDQLSFLGNDIVSVAGGSIQTGGSIMGAQMPLNENDFNALERLPDVEVIAATLEGRAAVQYRDRTISMYVAGVDPVMLEDMYELEIDSGRQLREGDRGVVVIGQTIANDIFDEKITVGRRLLMGNKSFTVVGIMKKGTGLMAAMDIVAYIPRDDARDVIPEFQGNRDLTEIHMKVTEGTNLSDFEEEVSYELMRLHKVTEENKDFTVVTADYINEQVGNITGALGLFLAGIAAISLFVGSIGIANTMFMGILERTREIGVMKALGATQKEIMLIFLIEAGILGTVGGAIGLVMSMAVSALASYFGLPSSVRPEVMAASILFSFIIGILAGYFPARQAAKLDVVEALRYE